MTPLVGLSTLGDFLFMFKITKKFVIFSNGYDLPLSMFTKTINGNISVGLLQVGEKTWFSYYAAERLAEILNKKTGYDFRPTLEIIKHIKH